MKLLGMRFLSSLAPRDRRAILIGAGALLAMLLAYWVLMPWVAHWMTCRDQIETAQGELAGLQARTAEYLHRRAMLIQRHGPGLARPLDDVQTANVNSVKALPDVFKAAGVQLQTILPQPGKPVKEFTGVCAVPFQVKANCSLPQLAQCLDALRGSETLIVVEQVNAVGNDKRPGQLEVTLVLSVLARQTKAGT